MVGGDGVGRVVATAVHSGIPSELGNYRGSTRLVTHVGLHKLQAKGCGQLN